MNVLFCWEIGAGYGHMQPILALAERIEQRGGRVSALLPESRYLPAFGKRNALAPSVLPGLELPVEPPAGMPHCWPDMIRNLGFAEADLLGPRLDHVIAEFRQRRPDVVVCEHAPTAMLAARAEGIPALAIGTGWTLPPAAVPMPGYRPAAPLSETALLEREQALLEAVNPVLRARGIDTLSSAADWLRADASVLKTWPKMDHYGARADGHYVGPIWQAGQGSAPDWPEGEGERVFCYLKGHWKGLHSLISSLGHLPLRALIHIDRERDKSFIAPANVRVSSEPVDMERVLHEGDFIISHGGHTLSCQALRAGVAQWVLPLHAEQEATAINLWSQGCGHYYTGSLGSARFARTLKRVLGDSSIRDGAALRARDLADWRLEGAIDAVVEVIESLK